MPHHLKNDCKNNGRLYQFLLKRRNKVSSFYMEASFANLVTGAVVCNLHSQGLFGYENASFAHLRMQSVVGSKLLTPTRSFLKEWHVSHLLSWGHELGCGKAEPSFVAGSEGRLALGRSLGRKLGSGIQGGCKYLPACISSCCFNLN